MFIFIIVVIGLIAFFVWKTYNNFVTIKARIGASIQEIGNQLKRQANLIPNLIQSTKGYLEQEKDIYDKITKARSRIISASQGENAAEMVKASQELSGLMRSINVVLEDNPELKSSETVANLMQELTDTSDKIMYARRTLIDLTADYNIKIVSFPSNLIGNMFGFKKEKGLAMPTETNATQVSSEETKTPKVDL